MKKLMLFSFLLLFIGGCVNGTTPEKTSDDIKGLTNNRDIHHYQLEQSPEADTFATQLELYLSNANQDLSSLGAFIDSRDVESAHILNQQLIKNGQKIDDMDSPFPFEQTKDLHHSYVVALQELEQALQAHDERDQYLHYGYATLTLRLFSREYESLANEYGIKPVE